MNGLYVFVTWQICDPVALTPVFADPHKLALKHVHTTKNVESRIQSLRG